MNYRDIYSDVKTVSGTRKALLERRTENRVRTASLPRERYPYYFLKIYKNGLTITF